LIKYLSKVVTIHNISEGGNIPPSINLRIVCQYDVYGNLIETYKSITDAAEKIGVDTSNIGHCCAGTRNKSKGFVWRYSTDSFNKYKVYINDPRKKPVIQYNNKGVIVEKYSSARQAAKINKVSQQNICSSCNGKTKYVGGYIWRWEGDSFDKFDTSEFTNGKKSVFQYNKKDKLINVFDSLTQANKITGICLSTLSKCANNKLDIAGGFNWRYKSDVVG